MKTTNFGVGVHKKQTDPEMDSCPKMRSMILWKINVLFTLFIRNMHIVRRNSRLMNRFTLDSIGEIGFGVDIGALEDPTSPFLASFDHAQKARRAGGVRELLLSSQKESDSPSGDGLAMRQRSVSRWSDSQKSACFFLLFFSCCYGSSTLFSQPPSDCRECLKPVWG